MKWYYQIKAGVVLVGVMGIYAWSIYGVFFMSLRPDDWLVALAFFTGGSITILIIGLILVYHYLYGRNKTTDTHNEVDAYDTIDIKRM